jgi:uncharacterized protein YcbK (DUF882 family)
MTTTRKRYPAWLPKELRRHWDRPWTKAARHHRGFKHLLWEHGYISPHFTREEWRCKDGTAVPKHLKSNAQRHAFHLEVLRHELGDVPLPGISFFRTERHNREIGGARESRHVDADASDHSKETVDQIGRDFFIRTAQRVFDNGGVGVYPGGSVHLDSRGWEADWTSF